MKRIKVIVCISILFLILLSNLSSLPLTSKIDDLNDIQQLSFRQTNQSLITTEYAKRFERSSVAFIIKLMLKAYPSFCRSIIKLVSFDDRVKNPDVVVVCGSNYTGLIKDIPKANVVIFSGGIGRGTASLFENLGLNGYQDVYLPYLNKIKPVCLDFRAKIDFNSYITESEIFAELYLRYMIKVRKYTLNDFNILYNTDSLLKANKINLILENQSWHTVSNFKNTRKILERFGLENSRILVMQNPIQQTRAIANARKYLKRLVYSFAERVSLTFENFMQSIEELKKLKFYHLEDFVDFDIDKNLSIFYCA